MCGMTKLEVADKGQAKKRRVITEHRIKMRPYGRMVVVLRVRKY